MIITTPSPGTEPNGASCLRRELVVDGSSESGVRARQFAADFLEDAAAELGTDVPTGPSDDVRLVVSELVTNAGKYASGRSLLTLMLDRIERLVQVSVWDANPELPLRLRPDAQRVGGHGLEIVHALCRSVVTESGPGGKHVHAALHY